MKSCPSLKSLTFQMSLLDSEGERTYQQCSSINLQKISLYTVDTEDASGRLASSTSTSILKITEDDQSLSEIKNHIYSQDGRTLFLKIKNNILDCWSYRSKHFPIGTRFLKKQM